MWIGTNGLDLPQFTIHFDNLSVSWTFLRCIVSLVDFLGKWPVFDFLLGFVFTVMGR